MTLRKGGAGNGSALFASSLETTLAETSFITDHQQIRDWAAARAGKPTMRDVPTGTGENGQVLGFVFGQRGDHESDDDSATESLRLVEWDRWLAAFDEQELALAVPAPQPGVIDESHQLLRR